MLRGCVAALSMTWIVGGCGADIDDAPLRALPAAGTVRVSSRDRIDVDVHAAEPIKLGKNTVVVKFPTRAGAELTAASALMPAHGHGSPAPVITREGDGYVVKDLVLYMSGRWELRLALRADAHEDEALVGVDVP